MQGRYNGAFSARMSPESRLAIFGSGPLSGGWIVTVSLWFKIDRDDEEMVLLHYGSRWTGVPWEKDHLFFASE